MTINSHHTAEVMEKIQWVRPKLVAQIEFTEWTKGNHLRHSRFIALRDDKPPRAVVIDGLLRHQAALCRIVSRRWANPQII